MLRVGILAAGGGTNLQALIDGHNVQQVAQMLGYDSTTAFITMFRKGLGQTPGRYLAELTTTSQ